MENNFRMLVLGMCVSFGFVLSACDKLGQNNEKSSEKSTATASEQSGFIKGFHSIDITGAPYARGFELPDARGQVRKLSDFKGKVVAVFFGYTQCPDVCPTTMLEMAQVKKALAAKNPKWNEALQVIFVSVDPQRDTPEVLSAYMGNFDASFIALRPSQAQLEQVAKEFKVFYRRSDSADGKNYTMDHTAGTYVFDKTGAIRLFTRYGAGVAPLVDDLSQLF